MIGAILNYYQWNVRQMNMRAELIDHACRTRFSYTHGLLINDIAITRFFSKIKERLQNVKNTTAFSILCNNSQQLQPSKNICFKIKGWPLAIHFLKCRRCSYKLLFFLTKYGLYHGMPLLREPFWRTDFTSPLVDVFLLSLVAYRPLVI